MREYPRDCHLASTPISGNFSKFCKRATGLDSCVVSQQMEAYTMTRVLTHAKLYVPLSGAPLATPPRSRRGRTADDRGRHGLTSVQSFHHRQEKLLVPPFACRTAAVVAAGAGGRRQDQQQLGHESGGFQVGVLKRCIGPASQHRARRALCRGRTQYCLSRRQRGIHVVQLQL